MGKLECLEQCKAEDFGGESNGAACLEDVSDEARDVMLARRSLTTSINEFNTEFACYVLSF